MRPTTWTYSLVIAVPAAGPDTSAAFVGIGYCCACVSIGGYSCRLPCTCGARYGWAGGQPAAIGRLLICRRGIFPTSGRRTRSSIRSGAPAQGTIEMTMRHAHLSPDVPWHSVKLVD